MPAPVNSHAPAIHGASSPNLRPLRGPHPTPCEIPKSPDYHPHPPIRCIPTGQFRENLGAHASFLRHCLLGAHDHGYISSSCRNAAAGIAGEKRSRHKARSLAWPVQQSVLANLELSGQDGAVTPPGKDRTRNDPMRTECEHMENQAVTPLEPNTNRTATQRNVHSNSRLRRDPKTERVSTELRGSAKARTTPRD